MTATRLDPLRAFSLLAVLLLAAGFGCDPGDARPDEATSAAGLSATPPMAAGLLPQQPMLTVWEAQDIPIPGVASESTGRPTPGSDDDPCDGTPTCECVLDYCLDLPVPVSLACESLPWEPACLDAVLEAWSEGGCGVPCQGVTLPGLDAICEMPECESMRGIVAGFVGQPICDVGCVCEPQCDGKACGDDGCGGSCGACVGTETCQEGVCVAADCTGDVNCPCMIESCLPSLPFITPITACGVLAEQPTCLEASLAAYEAAGECEGSCSGIDLPGLGALCDMPECGGVISALSLLGGDPCACYCEPQCDGKACGDDGCGGECGTCGSGEACLDDACYGAPETACPQAVTLSCAIDACEATPLPSTPSGLDMIAIVVEANPECHDAMMFEWIDEGCGAPCGSVNFPGLAALCTLDACEQPRGLMASLYKEWFCGACAEAD